MDEEQTKSCPNCKRDIPSVNFTIHTVHCARNIRVCPVCKEPVPLSDLQQHHDEFHKQIPCKQCGEKVCGTDLEDHLRDSCANTIKSCRYCELELARRELPAHEGYCGVRTEQCSDCREWVMIKYRQLHLDSNHGFLRLDDDPAPIPKKEVAKPNANTNSSINLPSTSNGFPRTSINNGRATASSQEARSANTTRNIDTVASSSGSSVVKNTNEPSSYRHPFGTKVCIKRTNDQPQININVGATEKVIKELPSSRGAVKKRIAPKPPAREPPPSPIRDMPYYMALKRHQREQNLRLEQNARNLAMGLPPVLNPSEKIEKLRKMDALQNREVVDKDYKNCLQGRVWMSTVQDVGNDVGRKKENRTMQTSEVGTSRAHPSGTPDSTSKLENPKNFASTSKPSGSNVKNKKPTIVPDPDEEDRRRDEFKNYKPMTTEEFMLRFNELQMRKDDSEDERRNDSSGDRFSQIKSSLRELRRGLNEVTAPYTANSGSNLTNTNNEAARLSPSIAMDVSEDEEADDVVELPCEFCGVQVPLDDLVQHQTGCRPDLAQFRPQASTGASSRAAERRRCTSPREDPVIPCEFCSESLPVYLITEHQKRCGRDNTRSGTYYAD